MEGGGWRVVGVSHPKMPASMFGSPFSTRRVVRLATLASHTARTCQADDADTKNFVKTHMAEVKVAKSILLLAKLREAELTSPMDLAKVKCRCRSIGICCWGDEGIG